MLSSLRVVFNRLFLEDSGQDLIEYAILTAVVTVGSLLVFVSIRTKMGTSYSNWQQAGQDRWVPPPAIVVPPPS